MSKNRYPNGKLNACDEGALSILVGEDNGTVVIHFGKPLAWVGMTPDMAMDLANSLMKHARSIGITKPVTIEL